MDSPPWAPTITDGSVTLRAHEPGDIDGVFAQCTDPLMQRWTRVPVPYERAHAEEFVTSRRQEWEAARGYYFAIESGGRFAGTINLRPDGARAAWVGYGLGPWARGHGTASRALRLILTWGFRDLGLDVVHWTALTGNWASRRAAWEVGFRLEGTVRGMHDDRGVRHDGWVGSLLAREPLVPAHPWLEVPLIRADELVLRPHTSLDLPRMVQAGADSMAQRWLTQIPDPYCEDDASAHLAEIAEEQAAGRSLYWAVADANTDSMLGEIAVFGLSGRPVRSGEIGYWTHPDARGRRVMTRALRLVARHVLLPVDAGGLGLARVVVRAAGGNAASQRVALAAGFRQTGVDRNAELLRDGSTDDLMRFDLLAAELGPA